MKKNYKIYLFTGIILMLTSSLLGCLDLSDSNTNSLVNKWLNPSKTKQAILFIKGGGATVSDSYQVSIIDTRNKLANSDTGNIFITDDNHSSNRMSTRSIKPLWTSDTTLQITYDKKLRILKKENYVNKVYITYLSQ